MGIVNKEVSSPNVTIFNGLCTSIKYEIELKCYTIFAYVVYSFTFTEFCHFLPKYCCYQQNSCNDLPELIKNINISVTKKIFIFRLEYL